MDTRTRTRVATPETKTRTRFATPRYDTLTVKTSDLRPVEKVNRNKAFLTDYLKENTPLKKVVAETKSFLFFIILKKEPLCT
jgi:hypothetical protein